MRGIAQRIRDLRQARGLAPEEAADQIGVSAPWWDDLERDDAEFDALDLSQVQKLAVILGVGPLHLLTGDRSGESPPPLSLGELRDLLGQRMAESGMDREAMEAKLGWDLGAFVRDPQAAWEYPLPFLIDLAGELGLDWRRAVADPG